jgi:hypothetical protein
LPVSGVTGGVGRAAGKTFEAFGPVLHLLKGGVMWLVVFGTPVALVAFVVWLVFVRWSQHGVDGL